MAANRVGKTECGAAELAYHLTGKYPPDWPGKRFDKPVRAWAAGVTSETTRDVVQTKLIGPPFNESEWGTGMIPKGCIASIAPARGIPAAIDTVAVRHASGGTSALQFKSFERGREKWQGAACEVIWFDEECPADIYSEGLTRTNETGGIVFCTFTPLDGVTEVVRRFLHEKNDDRHVTQATIDDAPHFSEEDKKRIAASYLPHEAEARIKGVPVLGSGRIFPVPEETIILRAPRIPPALATHRRNGLRLGSPFRRGGAGLGSRCGRGLRDRLSQSNASSTRGRCSPMGQRPAMGMASGRTA